MNTPVFTDNPNRCMKCGFCMSNCPVYRVDYRESHVARGRNMLILQAASGRLPKGRAYEQSLSHCLLCGRCRAVCPAKVSSPDINMAARAQLVQAKGLPVAKALVFRGLLKHRNYMAHLAGLASRLPGIGSKQGRPLRHMADLTAIFSGGIAVPRLSRPFLAKRLPYRSLPPKGAATKGRVGFFAGCGFEFFFAGMGQAMVAVLTQAGYEVIYPKNQGCCGLAVYSAGDVATARHMAAAAMDTFAEMDYIVTGCATCSSALKHYGHWFAEGDPLHSSAQTLADKVWDFAQFLHQHGAMTYPHGSRPLKVTYHDPCHHKWHQGISEAPRQLIKSLDGITYVEMEGADACCGLGGSFALTHRDTSLAIQAKKMAAIAATGADVVATACPGCLIQLMDGARRHQVPVRVMHISQLLSSKAYGEHYGK